MPDVWLNTYNLCESNFKTTRTAIDIGCRRGDMARYMCEDFQRVVGFDFRAKPAHIRKLRALPSNFEFNHIGLGEDSYVTHTDPKSGIIQGEGEFAVEITTLDSYEFDNVDFIKIDVEGYEPKVLAGAEKTIKKHWPVMCVEINTDDNNSQEILESWGYKLIAVDDLQGYDHIFVRA